MDATENLARRAKFKQQWRWIQNYRVWEANRKVFLYPETYIRPELRSTRTAAFKALQQNLQQGDITNDSVTQAYKKYLDEYTEVSRLIIAGGYVWQPDSTTEPNVSELALFGFTRTDPRRYHYRLATFTDDKGSSTAEWQAWQALGIDINSDRVYPVRAFGRTFVFWAETEQIKADDQNSTTLKTTTNGDIQQMDGEQKVQYRAKVMYSFCDLSDQWKTPQTLYTSPNEVLDIKDLHLQASVNGTETDGVESIVVDVQYDLRIPEILLLPQPPFSFVKDSLLAILGPLPRFSVVSLSADLPVPSSSVSPVSFVAVPADILDRLFDPSEISALNANHIIAIGSADRWNAAPWYSFDMKGGSFLARPDKAPQPTPSDTQLLPLAGNTEGLPNWGQVDACLDGSDGKQYLFHNQDMTYSVRGEQTTHRIDERWGLQASNVHTDGQVDAAWNRGVVFFLSRGDKYLKYSQGLDWADSEGERTTENQGKEDGVPTWPSIDAAFTDKKNTTWFFHGSKYVGVDGNNTFGRETDISQTWGVEGNQFTASAQGPVVIAAFSRGSRTFLIGPNSYTFYSDPSLKLCERPRPQSFRAILTDLECTNSDDAPEDAVVLGAMDGGTKLLFRVKTDGKNDVYSFANQKIKVVARESNPAPSQDITSFMFAGKRFALTPDSNGTAAVTVSGGTEQHAYSADIRATLLSPEGSLYLFGLDSFVTVSGPQISVAGIGAAIDAWASRSAPIANRWGRVGNAFTQGGPVSAALGRGEHTFLLSGDQYVRYSSSDYRFVDAGYPKSLADNPDNLPSFPFNAALQLPDGRTCYFIGTNHVFDNALSNPISNQTIWGRIGSNILRRGVDVAYRIDNKHYLFSGNEVACYTADAGNILPPYMNRAPLKVEWGSFGTLRGAFTYNDLLYLVGRDSFIRCNIHAPEQLLPGYPRRGFTRAIPLTCGSSRQHSRAVTGLCP
jgi:hypothetical protein